MPESVWRTSAPTIDWAKIMVAAHRPARREAAWFSAAPAVGPVSTSIAVARARKMNATARCDVEMASGRR